MIKPEVKRIEVGPVATNCYILSCPVTGSVIVIDPGDEPDIISEYLTRIDVIVYTHGHFDHSGGASELIRRFSPVTMIHHLGTPMLAIAGRAGAQWGFPVEQPPAPMKELRHGDSISSGDMRFKVIHTPGHSPGSICIYGHGLLFSGDTLFSGSIGRTDLPGSSSMDIRKSLALIINQVSPGAIVYPGHGPETTLQNEIRTNPYLQG